MENQSVHFGIMLPEKLIINVKLDLLATNVATSFSTLRDPIM